MRYVRAKGPITILMETYTKGSGRMAIKKALYRDWETDRKSVV